MRPISMWSDHGAPLRGRWWKCRSRRSTWSSTGLKILLAAGGVVVGVIGISGVYPQVIDAEWMRGARTYASRMPAPEAKPTAPDATVATRSDIPASVQPPPRSTAMPGGAAAATPGPAAPAPRPAAATSKPHPQAAPLAIAETADAAANADASSTPPPPVAAKSAVPVVKRAVSRAQHPRRSSPGSFAFGWGGSPFHM